MILIFLRRCINWVNMWSDHLLGGWSDWKQSLYIKCGVCVSVCLKIYSFTIRPMMSPQVSAWSMQFKSWHMTLTFNFGYAWGPTLSSMSVLFLPCHHHHFPKFEFNVSNLTFDLDLSHNHFPQVSTKHADQFPAASHTHSRYVLIFASCLRHTAVVLRVSFRNPRANVHQAYCHT